MTTPVISIQAKPGTEADIRAGSYSSWSFGSIQKLSLNTKGIGDLEGEGISPTRQLATSFTSFSAQKELAVVPHDDALGNKMFSGLIDTIAVLILKFKSLKSQFITRSISHCAPIVVIDYELAGTNLPILSIN